MHGNRKHACMALFLYIVKATMTAGQGTPPGQRLEEALGGGCGG